MPVACPVKLTLPTSQPRNSTKPLSARGRGMQWPKILCRAMSTKPARSSYPRWSGASQRPTPFIPKTDEGITPLSPPPSSTCSNPLPSRKPIPSPQGWASSRHIIPAAYPRTLAESTGTLERSSSPYTAAPGAAGPGESSDERKKRNLGEAKACVRARLDATPTLGNEGSNLWLAGERWTRKEGDSGSGLTLVVSAANGFTKEVAFQPVLGVDWNLAD